jgi:hypothetical protein
MKVRIVQINSVKANQNNSYFNSKANDYKVKRSQQQVRLKNRNPEAIILILPVSRKFRLIFAACFVVIPSCSFTTECIADRYIHFCPKALLPSSCKISPNTHTAVGATMRAKKLQIPNRHAAAARVARRKPVPRASPRQATASTRDEHAGDLQKIRPRNFSRLER